MISELESLILEDQHQFRLRGQKLIQIKKLHHSSFFHLLVKIL